MSESGECVRSIKGENDKVKFGVRKPLIMELLDDMRIVGMHKRCRLNIVYLPLMLMFLCALIAAGKRMESDEGASLKQCPVCNKVFARSSRSFHIARHMKRRHGTEGTGALKIVSSCPEPIVPPSKPKTDGILAKRNARTVKKVYKELPDPKSPEKLYVTASEAKNVPGSSVTAAVPKAKKLGGVKVPEKMKVPRDVTKEVRTADGPKIPSHPILFDRTSKVIVRREHPRKVLRDLMRSEEIGEAASRRRKKSRDRATQTTEMDWTKIGREVEYFGRLCKVIGSLKTPRELYQLGKAECPNLNPVLVKGIVDAQFPMDQDPEKKRELTTVPGSILESSINSQEESDVRKTDSRVCREISGLQMIANYSEDSAESDIEEPVKISYILQEDLRLSDSDDSSLMSSDKEKILSSRKFRVEERHCIDCEP